MPTLTFKTLGRIAAGLMLSVILLPQDAHALRCKRSELLSNLWRAFNDEGTSVLIGELTGKEEGIYAFSGFAADQWKRQKFDAEILWTKSCAGDYCGHDPETDKTIVLFVPNSDLQNQPVEFSAWPCAQNYLYLEALDDQG